MFRTPPKPPISREELSERAKALAGRSLAQVAGSFGLPVPESLRRHKGWTGQLLERALGATAGSRAEPDFPHLAVEMKSLPVNPMGKPKESTYVCTAPLDGSMAQEWKDSWVRRKLSTVLWVPIVTIPGTTDPGARRIGTPFMWSPSDAEEQILQRDWELLTGFIALGQLWELKAHHGEALQLRPKAANAAQRTWTLDEEGEWVQDVPRGFYLRPSFTAAILASRLRMPR